MKSAILNTTANRIKSIACLSALFPFVYNEGISYFALFGPLLDLLIGSQSNEANFNQNNPISETERAGDRSHQTTAANVSQYSR